MKLLPLCLVLALLLVTPTHLPSCGPFMESPVFTYRVYPKVEQDEFLKGKLGIIQPTFYRKFLVASFRHFAGAPLTNTEREAYVDTEVAGNSGKLRTDRAVPGSSYWTYVNCTPDAIETAARTLADRKKQFGADHAAVKSWESAQQIVFSNCSEGNNIPPPSDPASPPIFKADREYQIAAAHFYAQSFDEARARFLKIAADSQSPWHERAPYLAARSLVRKAMLAKPEGFDRALLEQADRELAAIPDAERLRGYVAVRLRPAATLAEVSRRLADANNEKDFARNLADFDYLMDRADGKSFAIEPGASELAAWIGAVQTNSPDPVARWRKSRTLQWLVAASMNSNDEDVIAAARLVPVSSPAYATVLYHRVRSLAAKGQVELARSELDSALPAIRSGQPISAQNQFLAQRQRLAKDLDEFLRFAPRKPVAVSTFGDLDSEAPENLGAELFLDEDSAKAFNDSLPLEVLRAALRSKSLPVEALQQLTRVAFTRSMIVGDHFSARLIAPLLAERHPEMKEEVNGYLAAKDPAARQFAAAFLLLKYPAMRGEFESGFDGRRGSGLDEPDHFRANWWCSMPEKFVPKPLAFLSPGQVKMLETETARRMKNQLAAPSYLGAAAIDWATGHTSDPRSPEALHLAVVATRYGCTGKDNGEVSKAAFTLLHRRWPKSEWAEQTKYWFN